MSIRIGLNYAELISSTDKLPNNVEPIGLNYSELIRRANNLPSSPDSIEGWHHE